MKGAGADPGRAVPEEARGEPCLRCGRVTARSGRRIGGRRVCPACAYHFREPEPCPVCGQMSKRLIHSKPHGQPACDGCRNRLTHHTCGRCRRYRPLGRWSDDGVPLCRACADTRRPAEHDCPDCGARVPGRGRGRCEPCLVRERFRRRVELERETFETDAGEALFVAYGAWLEERGLSAGLVRRMEAHAEVMRAIEELLDAAGQVDQSALLDRIGMDGVRRAETVTTFLTATRCMAWDADLARDWTERRRMADTLAQAETAGHGALIEDYHAHLEAGDRKRAPRTLRQYLGAALAFMEHAAKTYPGATLPRDLPDGAFDRYLHRQRGAASNLMAFRSYLVDRSMAPPKLPGPRSSPLTQCDSRLDARVVRMRRRLASSTREGERRALAVALLSDFYSVPRNQIAALPRDALAARNDGQVVLTLDDGHYDLPPWLGEAVTALQPADGEWLFPGRGGGRPMSPASVGYYVTRDGSAGKSVRR